MDDFQLGPYETAVGDAEILIELRVPLRANGGSAYEKVKRRAGDWAIAATGVALWLDGGTIADAGVGLSAVGPKTVHAARAEALLRGNAPSEELFAEAAQTAAEETAPSTDQRGPEDYKRHLARELTLRALRRAAARALQQEV
jgi:carbon-monoxide dehydrogenase medium subunit